eukprot:gene8977-biopygen1046
MRGGGEGEGGDLSDDEEDNFENEDVAVVRGKGHTIVKFKERGSIKLGTEITDTSVDVTCGVISVDDGVTPVIPEDVESFLIPTHMLGQNVNASKISSVNNNQYCCCLKNKKNKNKKKQKLNKNKKNKNKNKKKKKKLNKNEKNKNKNKNKKKKKEKINENKNN